MTGNGATWTFTYDANGMRTQRTNGTSTYTYVYNGSQLTYMTVDGNTLRIAYDANSPMFVKYNGTTYQYVTNLQGDVIAILDADGTAVVEYTYDAWGNILTTTGTMASTLGVHNPLRYRGYVYDTEIGFYYLQSRYYDPEIGRFLNADALVATGQGLLGDNMFAYCCNNPVLYVDPSGFLIVLAADATEEQIAEYERAVAYIKTSDTGRKLIELLEASLFTITIVFVDDDQMGYSPQSNTIFFDTNSGLVLKDRASTQSAALGLAHEMGHAAQDILGLLNNSYLTTDEIEAINLETYETPIAQELGEPTRGKYSEWSATRDMQNSTHFRTAITVSRPWWHYVLFWNLFVPNTITTDHNLID